jgi:DNA polymerase
LYKQPGIVPSSPGTKVLWVGEGPGKVELVQGKGFVGKAGMLLWKLCRRVAMEPNGDGRANTTKCLPTKTKSELYAAVECCVPLLDADLAASDADIVVAVGGVAFNRLVPRDMQSTWGTGSINVHRGRIFKVTLGGRQRLVVPIIHPAAIYNGWLWDQIPLMIRDLQRIKRLRRDGYKPMKLDYKDSQTRPACPAGVPVVIDIEGYGAIERVGVSWGPGIGHSSVWPMPGLADIMKNASVCVFHNAVYDIPRLVAAGMPMPRKIYDTLVASAILDPDLPNDLEFVSSQHTDLLPWKHLSQSNPAFYNNTDVDATYRILDSTKRSLWATGMADVFNTSMGVIPLTLLMTAEGIRVDVKEMRKRAKDCFTREQEITRNLWGEVKKVERRKERVTEAITEGERHRKQADASVRPSDRRRALSKADKSDKRAIALARPNFKSPTQIRDFLYNDWAADVKKFVRPKKDSTDEPTLRELHRKYRYQPLLDIVELRGLGTLRSKYYNDKNVGNDGRIHPEWFLSRSSGEKNEKRQEKARGARTARLASHPNVQNWPPESRSIIIPDDDDSEITEIDIRQAEFQVIAWKAGDGLYEIVTQPGYNPYVEFGKVAFPKLGVVKGHPQYLLCKKSVLSGCYKVGPLTFIRELTKDDIFIDMAEGRRLLGLLPRLFPQVAKYWREIPQEAAAKEYVANPFGRRRYFYGPRPDMGKMMNWIPQSTIGDIMLRVMKRIHGVRGGREYNDIGWRLLLQGHDSLVFTNKKKKRSDLLRVVVPLMEQTHKEMPEYRPETEVTHGPNWGSVKEAA